MAALVVVLFPIGLLLFLLFMERVEVPLRRGNDDDVEEFLDSAQQDEVDTLISGGLRKAMDRWRKRRRISTLLPRNGRRDRSNSGGRS